MQGYWARHHVVARDSKLLFTFVVAILAATIILAQGPIPQDPAYHAFADRRTLYGIPNFWNVVSNLPILVCGFIGLVLTIKKRYSGGFPSLHCHYTLFFAGAVLIGIGSSWYHLHPDNDTLVWDRVPMTLTFMALFSSILGENLSIRAGKVSLLLLLAAGIASVTYWHATEQAGQGDLRFYAMVQFLPLVLIPVIMVLFKSPFSSNRNLLWMLIAYMLAKITEMYDGGIYQMLNLMGGHALKHLFAALSVYFYYLALKHRVFNSSP